MPKILSVRFLTDGKEIIYRGGFMVNDGLWIILLFVALALVLTCAGIGVSLLLSPHYYHSKEQPFGKIPHVALHCSRIVLQFSFRSLSFVVIHNCYKSPRFVIFQ